MWVEQTNVYNWTGNFHHVHNPNSQQVWYKDIHGLWTNIFEVHSLQRQGQSVLLTMLLCCFPVLWMAVSDVMTSVLENSAQTTLEVSFIYWISAKWNEERTTFLKMLLCCGIWCLKHKTSNSCLFHLLFGKFLPGSNWKVSASCIFRLASTFDDYVPSSHITIATVDS